MRRILWFRRDLRVRDNPLISYGGEVLPIFIFDSHILDPLDKTDKRVSFIFSHVTKLKEDLRSVGLDLRIFYGTPAEVFDSLGLDDFDEVVASGDYDAYAKDRDREISLRIHFRYVYDTYLFKPKEVLKDDGSPYLVFTPFYKRALPVLLAKELQDYKIADSSLIDINYEGIAHIVNSSTTTLPLTLGSIGFERVPLACEDPLKKLKDFGNRLEGYQKDRDYLYTVASSCLSMDLRFGTIGIREIVRAIKDKPHSEAFIRQLIFRDFYAYLLFHFPTLQTQNYKNSFNGIENETYFKAFCSGQTGVPIVDAGVRELVQNGTMHNRVRMICASFFTKDLLLPWQWGEAFFAKYLLDFDAASNILSWQWSAGTGIDPQPYFRIFNPYLQSRKFDKDALYIKTHCKELANIPAKDLHDEAYLQNAHIKDYPQPLVDHKSQSKRAIELFKGAF